MSKGRLNSCKGSLFDGLYQFMKAVYIYIYSLVSCIMMVNKKLKNIFLKKIYDNCGLVLFIKISRILI
jgi:hypothetical protein